jgi:hypothetical protein
MTGAMMRSCAQKVRARMGTASRRWPAGVTQAGTGVARASGRNGTEGTKASAAATGSRDRRMVPWSSQKVAWSWWATRTRMVKMARPARQPVISVTQGIDLMMYQVRRGSARSQDRRR